MYYKQINIILIFIIIIGIVIFFSLSEKFRYEINGCSSDTCVICLDDLTPDTTVHPCTQSELHCFHKVCIDDLVKSGGKDCPICRSPLKPEFLPIPQQPTIPQQRIQNVEIPFVFQGQRYPVPDINFRDSITNAQQEEIIRQRIQNDPNFFNLVEILETIASRQYLLETLNELNLFNDLSIIIGIPNVRYMLYDPQNQTIPNFFRHTYRPGRSVVYFDQDDYDRVFGL